MRRARLAYFIAGLCLLVTETSVTYVQSTGPAQTRGRCSASQLEASHDGVHRATASPKSHSLNPFQWPAAGSAHINPRVMAAG